MINTEKATRKELIKEYDAMMELWGKYSCDCFGFYISALQRAILNKGGWTMKKNAKKKINLPKVNPSKIKQIRIY